MMRHYTAEQMAQAERLAKLIAGTPQNERGIILVAVNAFMAGLSARNTAKEERELELKEG